MKDTELTPVVAPDLTTHRHEIGPDLVDLRLARRYCNGARHQAGRRGLERNVMRYFKYCLKCAWAAALRGDWTEMRMRLRWSIGWCK